MKTIQQFVGVALVLTSTILAVSACTEPDSEASNEPTTLQINDETRFSVVPSNDDQDRGSCFAEPCVYVPRGVCDFAYNADDVVFVTVTEVAGLYPPSTNGLPPDECDYPFNTGSNKFSARVEYSLMGKSYDEELVMYDKGFIMLGKNRIEPGDLLLVNFCVYKGYNMIIIGSKVAVDGVLDDGPSYDDSGSSVSYDIPTEVGELQAEVNRIMEATPQVACTERNYATREVMIRGNLKEGCR